MSNRSACSSPSRTTARLRLAPALTFIALAASRGALAADKQGCVAAYEHGQELRNQGHLRAGRQTFAVCAQDGCPVLVRSDCVTWLREIDARQPTIIVRARDAAGHDRSDVSFAIDGGVVGDSLDGRAIAVDPGRHTLRWTRGQEPPVEQEIVVSEGEKNRVISLTTDGPSSDTPPAREPTAGGLPLGSYLLGSVGIAAVGLSVVFEVMGFTGLSPLYHSCAPDCARSAVDGHVTELRIGDVAGAVGLLSLGGAVWLALAKPKTTTAGVRLLPLPIAGAAGAGVGVAF